MRSEFEACIRAYVIHKTQRVFVRRRTLDKGFKVTFKAPENGKRTTHDQVRLGTWHNRWQYSSRPKHIVARSALLSDAGLGHWTCGGLCLEASAKNRIELCLFLVGGMSTDTRAVGLGSDRGGARCSTHRNSAGLAGYTNACTCMAIEVERLESSCFLLVDSSVRAKGQAQRGRGTESRRFAAPMLATLPLY